jgi:hypothetical protein
MVAAANILGKSMMIRVWDEDRRDCFMAEATRVLQEAGKQVGGMAARQKALRWDINWAKWKRQVGVGADHPNLNFCQDGI